MKKIVISGDVLCVEKISGIPRYAYEVIKNLDELLENNKDKLDIQICYPKGKKINLPKLKNIPLVELNTNGKRFGSNVLRHYVNDNNAVCCHFGNGISYNRNGVVCIHDIRAIDERQYDCMRKYLEMQILKKSVKRMHSLVVTVSDYQKNRIIEKFKISEKRIEVIPNGWEHIAETREDNTIFERFNNIQKYNYYYSLGSVAPHKNFVWIYEMAKKYPQKQFVIAGNISKKYWGIDENNIKLPNIIITGYITDEENKALMNGCKAFLHPSKYEGFGIPPLEALALGKKIIISNATCLPEIYGKSAAYFDPDDYDVDLDKLEEESIGDVSKVLEKYTWKNAAIKWLNVFEIVGGG